MTLHGWFSAEQATLGGVLAYRTPDGREVHVTEVTEDGGAPSTWPDMQPRGEVTDYVRKVLEGLSDDMRAWLKEMNAEIARRASAKLHEHTMRIGTYPILEAEWADWTEWVAAPEATKPEGGRP